ncbi:MAG: DUF5071 domain-containing protein [Rhodocyclaceae bacterium]|nr:DUF5071 domain-containing protein [Rhodocyclaceae bacterium]MCA3079379.1 DUF5071 domain-containing protein [Rhodocyclaceae bacterium]MCA6466524.1 DUF5071 domain-containing protein [Chitinophagaceae bacterium]
MTRKLAIKSKYDGATAEKISLLPENELVQYADELIAWCSDPNTSPAMYLIPTAVAHPKLMVAPVNRLIVQLSTNESKLDYDGIRNVLLAVVSRWPIECVAPLAPSLDALLRATNIPDEDKEVLGAVSFLIVKFQLDVTDDMMAYARRIVEAHPHWLP